MHVPPAPREPVSSAKEVQSSSPARAPSLTRAHAWLFGSGVCDDRGRVQSWLNPEKPGYVYPEIMGYYASLCAERAHALADSAWLERGQLVGKAVVASLSPAGGLGRAGIDYTFDTGIGLCGLARLDRVAGRADFIGAIARMRDFLGQSLGQHVVAWKDAKAFVDDTSWSMSFGASALKTAIALDLAATSLGDPSARELGKRITREVVDTCFRRGSFQINAKRDWVYAHAHCYAVEGLIALSSRGLADASSIAPAALWLAQEQNADGSITNWHRRPEVEIAHQGDATSQAVRIWTFVDRGSYGQNIARALEFLAGLQTASGGLRYNAASEDVNAWVSMFAAQACSWVEGTPQPEWLL